MSDPADTRAAQLHHLAACGWELFPTWWVGTNGVCACREGPDCSRPGKHPRVSWQSPEEGRSGATAEWRQLAEWHALWPEANWAVRLRDHWVLDVDPKHGGTETLRQLEEHDPELLGITLVTSTPSGGRHLFYRQPPERDVVTLGQGQLPALPGCEVKALRRDGHPGSYVLVPPGAGRAWVSSAEVADASPRLLRLVREARNHVGVGTSGGDVGQHERFDFVTAMTPGAIMTHQNTALFRAACSLRTQAVSDSLALAVLGKIVEAFVNTDPGDPWTLQHAVNKWTQVKNTYPPGRTPVELTPAQTRWVAGARPDLPAPPVPGDVTRSRGRNITVAPTRERRRSVDGPGW